MKYFAYGSNLDEVDLAAWCARKGLPLPRLLNPEVFCLPGYRLDFTKMSRTRKGGVADIVSSQGDSCYGVVFDVEEEDLKIIDEKEGAPNFYARFSLPNGMISYGVMKKENFVQPHSDYIDIILRGAIHYGLPQIWIDKLESFKT